MCQMKFKVLGGVMLAISFGVNAALTHQYLFEDNVNDSIGTWNATGYSAVYSSDSSEGNKSLSLSDSSYAVISGVELAEDFTIEMDVKFASLGNQIQGLIATGAAGAQQQGFKLFVNAWGTGSGHVILETGDGSSSAGAWSDEGIMPVNEWVTLRYAVNGSTDTGYVYLNDGLIASGSVVDFDRDRDIYIGRFSDGNFKATALLDDVRIYNEVIPEPVALGMIAAAGAGMLFIRRRFMI